MNIVEELKTNCPHLKYEENPIFGAWFKTPTKPSVHIVVKEDGIDTAELWARSILLTPQGVNILLPDNVARLQSAISRFFDESGMKKRHQYQIAITRLARRMNNWFAHDVENVGVGKNDDKIYFHVYAVKGTVHVESGVNDFIQMTYVFARNKDEALQYAENGEERNIFQGNLWRNVEKGFSGRYRGRTYKVEFVDWFLKRLTKAKEWDTIKEYLNANQNQIS